MPSILNKIVALIVIFVFNKQQCYSQNVAACNNLQNVCSNPIFSFSAGAGFGLIPGNTTSNPFANPQAINAGCMFTNVANPQWLLINVTSSGNLGFVFGSVASANPQAGNYDWIMWPYSSNACANIFNNTLPPVACNFNCTGGGGTGMGIPTAGGSPCNFQPSIPVLTGQQFIILITNPSGVNTNVSFANNGSAGISCNPLSINNATACPNQPTVLTATWTGASSTSYTILPGSTIQTSPIFTVSAAASQIFTVIANGLNAMSLPITETKTFALTINSVTPISIINPTNYCYNSNATFTINPLGAIGYTVTGPGIATTILATTNISLPNMIASNIGTFSVIATYSTGCTGTITAQVNVAPNNSIAVNTISNVCQGANINLTAALPTATAYVWAGPNGFTSNIQNPSITSIQPLSSGIYLVSSNVNFNGIACPKTNTTQINVVATNLVAVTANFTLCQGSNLNLISTALGAVSYSWNGPAIYSSALQNPTINSVLPAAAGNYTAIAFFTNGALTCSTTAVSNVSVVATNTVAVITPTNICQNLAANLSANALGAISYSWTGPNSFNSNIVAPSILNIQTNATGIYTASALFTLGTVSCSTSNTNQINVVATNPVGVTANFTLCQGSNLNLISTALGAVSYSWNGPAVYSSALQNPTLNSVLPSTAGNYTAIAFFTNGALNCSITAVSNVSIVATNTVAVNTPTNICQNLTANLSANALGAVSYSWTGPNSFNSNLIAPTILNIQTNATGIYSASALFVLGTVSCSTSNTNQINVVATNPAAVTANFTLCQGSNLNLTSNAVGAVSYSWNGPAVYSSASQNSTLNSVLPAAAGNYTAIAFFTNGALTCSTTAISNVSVVATNPVNIVTPANICQYLTANFNANAVGATSYVWDGPNAFTSLIAAPNLPSIQTNASGTYTVSALFNLGAVTCSTSNTSIITVVPVNTITVIPTLTVCNLGTTVLQASAIGANSYAWVGPNTFTSSLQNPNIYLTPFTANGIYTVTTTFLGGAIACTNSNTINLIVNPILTFSLNPFQQVCHNSSVTVTGPAGATSYTWVSNTGFGGNTQNLNFTNIDFVASGVYTLFTSVGNCVTSEITIIDVIKPIQYTLTPNPKTICRGDSLKLIVGSAFGSGNYAYEWNPQLYLSSSNGSTQTCIPLGNSYYNVTAYDIACPQYSINYAFTVKVNQPPLPNLILQKTQGCEPLCLFYNTKVQSESAITTYDFGGGIKLDADSFSYCINQPGTYNLKIYSEGKNGCKSVYNFNEKIIVFPKPHADIIYTPDNVTTADNQVTFNASYKYGPIVHKWWQFTGSAIKGIDSISNVVSQQRIYENVGKYPVLLISETDKGCIDTIVKFIDVVDDYSVFIPNTFTPNGDGLNDLFNIKGNGISKERFNMEIFDRWGSLIFKTNDIFKGWDGFTKGQLSENDVYIYKIKILGATSQGFKNYVGHVSLIK